MHGPNPSTLYPLKNAPQLAFLKHFIKAPNIIIGDYTYYDDQRYGPENFEKYNILYNHAHSKVKLTIGRFCALAAETKFIMSGDHKLDGFSTYPFPIFQQGWERAYDISDLPVKGDIVVGNDVWFGYDSLIKNGVTIGSGSIIAARAVVVKDVPAYSVIAGNPARVVKMRFDDKTIEKLLKLAWWDWEIEKITAHLSSITHANLEQLEEATAHFKSV
jgi:virginiamycin A acetyltransferase